MFTSRGVAVVGGEYLVTPQAGAGVHRDLRAYWSFVQVRLDGAQSTCVLAAVPNLCHARSFYDMASPEVERAADVAATLRQLAVLARGQAPVADAMYVRAATFTHHQHLTRSAVFRKWFGDDVAVLEALERDYAMDFGFALIVVPAGVQSVASAWGWSGTHPVALIAAPVRPYRSADWVVAMLQAERMRWTSGRHTAPLGVPGDPSALDLQPWMQGEPPTQLAVMRCTAAPAADLEAVVPSPPTRRPRGESSCSVQ